MPVTSELPAPNWAGSPFRKASTSGPGPAPSGPGGCPARRCPPRPPSRPRRDHRATARPKWKLLRPLLRDERVRRAGRAGSMRAWTSVGTSTPTTSWVSEVASAVAMASPAEVGTEPGRPVASTATTVTSSTRALGRRRRLRGGGGDLGRRVQGLDAGRPAGAVGGSADGVTAAGVGAAGGRRGRRRGRGLAGAGGRRCRCGWGPRTSSWGGRLAAGGAGGAHERHHHDHHRQQGGDALARADDARRLSHQRPRLPRPQLPAGQQARGGDAAARLRGRNGVTRCRFGPSPPCLGMVSPSDRKRPGSRLRTSEGARLGFAATSGVAGRSGSGSSWRRAATAASRTSVSTTIVVEPTCNGRATAVTVPSRTAPRKFVFDSIVDVPTAPSGRLANAHAPPAESASAITHHRAGVRTRCTGRRPVQLELDDVGPCGRPARRAWRRTAWSRG